MSYSGQTTVPYPPNRVDSTTAGVVGIDALVVANHRVLLSKPEDHHPEAVVCDPLDPAGDNRWHTGARVWFCDMRILAAVTAHPIPITDGMRLHVWHLLAELRKDHEIILVSSPLPTDDVSPAALDQICSTYLPVPPVSATGLLRRLRIEIATLASGNPKVVEQLIRSDLPAAVSSAASNLRPDVVHLETGATAAFATTLGFPAIVVPLDADDRNAAASTKYSSGVIRRWLAAREARRWQRFERTAYHQCDAIVVVTERDAESLLVGDPRVPVRVVANGVDSTQFVPPEGPRRRDVVLFHGAMDYPPNIDAALFAANEVFPLLLAREPGVKLVLAGRNPDKRILNLAGPHIEVTGELPDLIPLLQSASVYFCPMRLGSGIKNKLLEAFACGCPTVGTSVAATGMGVVAGREMLIADDAPGLAKALESVLTDPHGLARRLGSAARLRALDMSWNATAVGFEHAYTAAIERHASTDARQVNRGA